MPYKAETSRILGRSEKISTGKFLFQVASAMPEPKVQYPMMDTEVGRYALEIQKTSLQKLSFNDIRLLIKAASIVQTINDVYVINLKLPEAINGNATRLSDIPDGTVDPVSTAPPRLPASSAERIIRSGNPYR